MLKCYMTSIDQHTTSINNMPTTNVRRVWRYQRSNQNS